jgi:HAD superfamily hydrolase (TIGR01509 family)
MVEAKAYIFDLDGTLIDSMGEWGKVLPSFLEERNIPYPPDLVKRVVAFGLPGVAKYCKENFPVEEEVEEILQYFIDKFKYNYATNIQAKPYAKEVLTAMREKGIKVCLLTAGMHVLFDACLHRLGLWDLLDYRWSSDDFPYKKSEPNIYIEVANRLGLDVSECVMVDDSIGALRPAKEAGMQTIAIYDDFSKDNEKAMRELADRYIYDLKELL